MSVFHIKIIAMLTMLIDHIGALFFPEIIIFRIIGRLSFPLFAWLIANGAHHTRNMSSYIKRLLLLAVVAQIPYTYAILDKIVSFESFNVVVTLVTGLLLTQVVKKTGYNLRSGLLVILTCLAALYLNFDYGAAGILMVMGYFIYFDSWKKSALVHLVIILFFYTLPYVFSTIYYGVATNFSSILFLQPISLISLLFIYVYDGRLGPRATLLFYIFYPLHLLVLGFILRSCSGLFCL